MVSIKEQRGVRIWMVGLKQARWAQKLVNLKEVFCCEKQKKTDLAFRWMSCSVVSQVFFKSFSSEKKNGVKSGVDKIEAATINFWFS